MDLKSRIERLIIACMRARNPGITLAKAYVRVYTLSKRQPHLLHLAHALQCQRNLVQARAGTDKGSAERVNKYTRQRDFYLAFYGFVSRY